jgi:hypothetical protein
MHSSQRAGREQSRPATRSLIAPRADPQERSLAHAALIADETAKRGACPHTRPPVGHVHTPL